MGKLYEKIIIAFIVTCGCTSNEEMREVNEQGFVEDVYVEDVVDSIKMDSAEYMYLVMPAEYPDTIGRYTIYSESGKLGIFDTWKNVNVTPAEFDELRYAQRNVYETRANTHFNMRIKKEHGTVCINEADNDYEIQVLVSFE